MRVDGGGKEGGGKREAGIVVDIGWEMRMGAPVRYDRRNGWFQSLGNLSMRAFREVRYLQTFR